MQENLEITNATIDDEFDLSEELEIEEIDTEFSILVSTDIHGGET